MSKLLENDLLVQPDLSLLGLSNFLLELQQAIHQAFSSWRAARDVNVNWYYSVTASYNRVGVMIVATTICT